MTTFYRRQTAAAGNYPPAPPNSPLVPFWPQTLPPATLVGRLLGTGPTEAIPLAYVLAALSSSKNVQTITAAGSTTILSTTDLVIINKSVATVTPLQLGSVALRSNRQLWVHDYTGIGGDITLTPFGSEKINSLSSWAVASGGAGMGGGLMLQPVEALSGWLAR